MRSFATQVLLAFALAGLVIPPPVLAVTTTEGSNGTQGYLGTPLLDKTTRKEFCSQAARGAVVNLPGGSIITLNACSTSTLTDTDFCTASAAAGRIPCLGPTGQFDPAMIPSLTPTGTETSTVTGNNNYLPKYVTYTVTESATGTATGTVTLTKTSFGNSIVEDNGSLVTVHGSITASNLSTTPATGVVPVTTGPDLNNWVTALPPAALPPPYYALTAYVTVTSTSTQTKSATAQGTSTGTNTLTFTASGTSTGTGYGNGTATATGTASGSSFYTSTVLGTGVATATLTISTGSGLSTATRQNASVGESASAASEVNLGRANSVQTDSLGRLVLRMDSANQLTMYYGNDAATRYPYITMARARGSLASPTSAVAGDAISGMNSYAYNGFGYSAVSGISTVLTGWVGTNAIGKQTYYVANGTDAGANLLAAETSALGHSLYVPLILKGTSSGSVTMQPAAAAGAATVQVPLAPSGGLAYVAKTGTGTGTITSTDTSTNTLTGLTCNAATTSTQGCMSAADKTKLDGVAAAGQTTVGAGLSATKVTGTGTATGTATATTYASSDTVTLSSASTNTATSSVTATGVTKGNYSGGVLTATATLVAADLPTSVITGTGTTNYVPIWTSASALGTSPIAIDVANTRVGIGLTNPSVALDVAGSIRASTGYLYANAIIDQTASYWVMRRGTGQTLLGHSDRLAVGDDGSLKMTGATSGVFTLSPPATVTSYTLTPPAAAATAAGQVMASTGANATMQWITPLTNASPFTIDGATSDMMCGQLSDYSNLVGCAKGATLNLANVFVHSNGSTYSRLHAPSTGGYSTVELASGYGSLLSCQDTVGCYSSLPMSVGDTVIPAAGRPTVGGVSVCLANGDGCPAGGGGTGMVCTGTCTDGRIAKFLSGGLDQATAGSDYVAPNAAITASGATNKIVQYDAKGLVVSGTDATAANVGAPPTSRTISTTNGLQGGGDLSANRTFSPVYGTTANTVMQGNDTRVDNAANKQLSNLSSVAFNTSLIPDTTGVYDVGSGAKTLNRVYTNNLRIGGVDATAVPTASAPVIADASGTVNSWVTGAITTEWTNAVTGGATINPDSAWHDVTSDTFAVAAGSTIEVFASVEFEGPYDDTKCALAIFADTSAGTTHRGVKGWTQGPRVLSASLGTAHTRARITGLSGTVVLKVKAWAVTNSCSVPSGSNFAETYIQVRK